MTPAPKPTFAHAEASAKAGRRATRVDPMIALRAE